MLANTRGMGSLCTGARDGSGDDGHEQEWVTGRDPRVRQQARGRTNILRPLGRLNDPEDRRQTTALNELVAQAHRRRTAG